MDQATKGQIFSVLEKVTAAAEKQMACIEALADELQNLKLKVELLEDHMTFQRGFNAGIDLRISGLDRRTDPHAE